MSDWIDAVTTPRLFRVILPVRDIERAVQFYSHIFDEKGERVSPGRHYYRCGDVILACYSPAADGDAVAGGWHHHENQILYFAVPDLPGMCARVAQAGGTVVAPIETMPWGERLCYALDPEGIPLSFVDEQTVFTGSG